MWPRRLLRGLMGLVLVVLVLLLTAWIALPLWIEGPGVRKASEQLGRPVSLTAAHFNPWRLALRLEGLRIGGPVVVGVTGESPAAAKSPDAVTPQGASGAASSVVVQGPKTAQTPDLLAVKQIDVVVSPRSVLHFAPILSSLRIDSPTLRLALLGEGRTDVDDILARLASQPAAEPATPAKEPDLALYNIELIQGDIQLDDRHAGMVHKLSGLQLGVPFLSTLDADVEVDVQPHLAGQLNGVAFQTDAQAQPFAQTRNASLRFKLDGLDLSAYRAYWPKTLPMRLAQGLVDAQLTLDFRQPVAQTPELKISGQADVRELALQRRSDAGDAGSADWQDWLSWKRVSVGLADVQPLRRQVLLDRLTIEGPELRLTRDAQGRLWLPVGDAPAAVQTAQTTPTAPATRKPLSSSTASSNPAVPAGPVSAAPQVATGASTPLAAGQPHQSSSPAATDWRFGLRQLELSGGRVWWQDASLTPTAQWRVDGLSVKSSGLAWPLAGAAAPVEVSATVAAVGLPTAEPQGKTKGGVLRTRASSASGPVASAKAAGPNSARSAGAGATEDGSNSASAGTKAAAAQTRATSTPSDGAARFHAKGQLSPNGIAVDWDLEQLSLAWLGPYLRPVTPLAVTGQLEVQGRVTAGPQGDNLKLGLHDLRVSALQLLDNRKAVASLAELSLDKADLTPASQELVLGRLALKQPQAQLARDSAGRWNWADWIPANEQSAHPPATGAPTRERAATGAASAVRPPRAEVARRHAHGASVLRLDPMSDEPRSETSSASASASASASRPASALVAASTASAPQASPSAWRARLAELVIEGGQVQLLDQFTHVLDDEPARPIGVQELAVRVTGVDWDGQQLRQALPVRVSLVARRPDVTRRINREAPRLQWEGQVALAPLRVSGKLQADHLPLHWADPYLDPSIGIHLQRAEGSFKGDVKLALPPAGPRVQVTGDVLLSELRLRQARLQDGRRRSAEDLLSWQALRLSGFKLQLAPSGVPDVAIQQASLDEFYARLIINEQGRLNLRDLRQTEQGQAVAAMAGASAPATGAQRDDNRATSQAGAVAGNTPRAGAGGASVASAPASAASGPPVRLSIAETRVNAGQVDFNDRFVKPNYSAKLTELTGTLGGFSAGSADMAPLQLRGRVAGTGLLDISGQLNPSGAPLALDITASATDIELAPLSPYAGKYAGYAIERGKLSSRVHYRIEPNGQLVADNKIVLNQLSFGDPIDSPDATKLPVRLAVALLKDSNGVIDVNLPVSGSINDPEFSIGGVVVKLIVNLLTKALTAPFSLLSGGGSSDMSQLDFAAGTAALQPATERSLDSVAKVLGEKPSLQLSITGWVDPAGERRAAQAAKLEEALQAERRRELRRQQTPASVAAAAGAAASAASAPDGSSSASGASSPAGLPAIVLDDAQRQRLLKVVYDNAKLPNKPRNLLGLAKDLPPAEMRELLMDSYTISDEQMRELALQRSVAVRDALIAKGVPNARLFLASPKLHEGKDGQAWQPKVDLSLSTQ